MRPFRQLLKIYESNTRATATFQCNNDNKAISLSTGPIHWHVPSYAKPPLGLSNPRRVLAWHRYRHLARLWRQSRISIGDIPLPHHTPTTHKSLPMGFRRLLLLAKIIVFAPITMVIHVVSLFEFSANHLLLLFIIQFCQHFLPRPLETILGPIQ